MPNLNPFLSKLVVDATHLPVVSSDGVSFSSRTSGHEVFGGNNSFCSSSKRPVDLVHFSVVTQHDQPACYCTAVMSDVIICLKLCVVCLHHSPVHNQLRLCFLQRSQTLLPLAYQPRPSMLHRRGHMHTHLLYSSSSPLMNISMLYCITDMPQSFKLKPVLLLPTLFLILQIVTIPLLKQTHQFQPITNAQCGQNTPSQVLRWLTISACFLISGKHRIL